VDIPEFRDVPVFVTGGAGFIGSHLVDALVAQGASVRVLDNLSTGRRENLAESAGTIDFLEGDIRDPETCARACHGVQYVFHLAALGSVPRSMRDPGTTMDVNVCGTANVLAAARDAGVRRVVYASSSSVYGDSTRLPKREGEEGRPLSPYALSKVMNEQTAELFFRLFGLETVGLRFFNVYGPRQSPKGPYAAVIPRFLYAARRGEPLVVFGDGEQRRDFTYVAAVVALSLKAILAPARACGRAYNAGGGNGITLNDLAALIKDVARSDATIVHADPRPGDIRYSVADPALASREIGAVERIPPRDGLGHTWATAESSDPGPTA
jgi:nucleoside-diphosphate-sugar epimerase